MIKIIYLSISKAALQSLIQVKKKKKKFFSIFSSPVSQYWFQPGGLLLTRVTTPSVPLIPCPIQDLSEIDASRQWALTGPLPHGGSSLAILIYFNIRGGFLLLPLFSLMVLSPPWHENLYLLKTTTKQWLLVTLYCSACKS